MPRYYCDYCDTYLTHDSPSVRKQHNAGYKHKANVRTYYQQFEEQQTQSLIDQRIKEHLGQAAAFQVGASFNQHLMSFQANAQRPRLPILAPPIMPVGMPPQNPMVSPLPLGVRPPVLPRPVGVPGYGAVPTVPSMAPPGAASMPMQFNNLPRPPMMPPPIVGTPTSTSNGPTSIASPVMYQVNPPAPTGGYNAYPSPASGVQSGAPAAPSPSVTSASTNAPPSENSH